MLKKYARKVKCLGWCNKEFMSPNPIYIRLCNDCKKRSHVINARRGSKYIPERD
jgi:hypothetical protein